MNTLAFVQNCLILLILILFVFTTADVEYTEAYAMAGIIVSSILLSYNMFMVKEIVK